MAHDTQLEEVTFDSLQGSTQNFLYSDKDIAFIVDPGNFPQYLGVHLTMYAIFTCIKGKVTLNYNNTPQTVTANEMFVCVPNSIVTDLMLSTDNTMHIILLSQRALQGLLRNEISIWNHALYVDKKQKFKVPEKIMAQLALYEDLCRSKLETIEQPYGKLSITAVFQGLLYDLCGVLEHNRQGNDTLAINYMIDTTKPQEVIFRQFISNLQNEKMKRRPVSYYAGQLCISSKYLSTIVKHSSNRTVMDWIHEYVNADIRYYLYNSSMSIKEICHRLNFTNLSFFGKYVKTQFGCSPRKLRAQVMGLNQTTEPIQAKSSTGKLP